jgi:4-hydroxy-tetrahydrodipicolinate reductase
MDRVRVVVYGVGAMGSQMVRLLRSKPRAQLVGAIDIDAAKVGRDLGDVAGLGEHLGIPVQYPPESVLDNVEADVVLHATTAFMDDAFPLITNVLKRKMNVITIAQELFFPLGSNRDKARLIDELAKDAGVSATAVGINPGFIMDILPILCSTPCWQIKRVSAQRNVDFSPYGPDEMRHIGAGLSPEAFDDGARRGEIGHIGLLETAAMVAYCLGIPIDELRQTKSPITSQTARQTPFARIAPGEVCGFRQSVVGYTNNETFLELKMVGIVAPTEDDGIVLGDHALIEGTPNVDIRIKEQISQKGGVGTAAVAVNMIPSILRAEPGFHTMNQLGLPHIWTGRPEPLPIETITNSRIRG